MRIDHECYNGDHHHITVSGRYGIEHSGTGPDREQLLNDLATSVQAEEIETERSRNNQMQIVATWFTGALASFLVIGGVIWMLR